MYYRAAHGKEKWQNGSKTKTKKHVQRHIMEITTTKHGDVQSTTLGCTTWHHEKRDKDVMGTSTFDTTCICARTQKGNFNAPTEQWHPMEQHNGAVSKNTCNSMCNDTKKQLHGYNMVITGRQHRDYKGAARSCTMTPHGMIQWQNG